MVEKSRKEKMEVEPTINLGERFGAIEIPTVEVLSSQTTGFSDLFPADAPAHTPAEMRDYPKGERPRPGTPLYPVVTFLEAAIARCKRNLSDENARRTFSAAIVQKKLVSSINQSYMDIRYADYPHTPDTYMIDQYIENQDEIRHHIYSTKIKDNQKLLDRLRGKADGIVSVPEHVKSNAYACALERRRVVGKVKEREPVSAEVEKEAYRLKLAKEMKKNRLRLQRLKFEWISARVMVDFLRESTDPSISSDELALARQF